MKEQKGFAITSMVLGVVSLALTLCCFGFSSYAMLPVAVVGLVLGIISLVKHRAGFYRAVVGVIMCSMTVILAISFIVFILIKYGSDVIGAGAGDAVRILYGCLNQAVGNLLYGYLKKYVYWYWYLALGLAVVGLIVMIIILFIRRKAKK